MREALLALIETLLRPVGGAIGIRLRAAWYRRRLASCGRGLIVAPDVHLIGARWMEFGDDVLIDYHSVLIAGPAKATHATKDIALTGVGIEKAWLRIGDRAHIGIGTVIQAHAGVAIGSNFTTSTGCRIYSRSNDPQHCRSGTLPAPGVEIGYVDSPCRIGGNVWLGIDCVMVGGDIGDDCFALPKSMLMGAFPANSRIAGNPARPIGQRFDD